VDNLMETNGHYKAIETRLDQLDSRLDQTLDNLASKVEILAKSIEGLNNGIHDFKTLFNNAVPLKVVIILLAIVAAIFGLTESIKMALH